MADLVYQDPFPQVEDATPYRLLTGEHVAVFPTANSL
jgi:hypothetical protein